jgi:1-acyl-sn-glycerol-3-phosphate acyltransferase
MFPPELPPIKNRALYVYRVFAKWFSFFFFGFCTVLLLILIFPPMRIIFHPRERFKKYGRRFISASMRFFLCVMHIIGSASLDIVDRDSYRNLRSKIIVANHPSLLDVIMLLSLIPNADCIVAGYVDHSILRGVVRQLYILNSDDYDGILDACAESLKQGNCLIVFPEGTRTPRSGKIIIRKGAARIALSSGCGILPLHIGGTDKYGLGKRDPWTGYNPRERYIYRITMKEEIHPDKYMALSRPAATRALTKEIADTLFPARET